MDIYYEKNIINKLMEEHSGRFKVFDAIKKCSLILLILASFFVLLFHDLPVSLNAVSILLTLLSALAFLLPFIFLYVFFTIYLAKKAVEFDYYLLGTVFRVVKVVNRKKRKLLVETPISSVSSIGKINSDAYNRFIGDKDVKLVKAYCNKDSNIIYAYLPHNGERKLVLMEADDDFLTTLRKSVSLSVLDDSIRKPIKQERAK